MVLYKEDTTPSLFRTRFVRCYALPCISIKLWRSTCKPYGPCVPQPINDQWLFSEPWYCSRGSRGQDCEENTQTGVFVHVTKRETLERWKCFLWGANTKYKRICTHFQPTFRRFKAGPPLDLSFWSFLTFLHHGIEEIERHLLWKVYKKIRRKSWSNVPSKLVACIGFLFKVVHKIGRLRKFNRSRGI